MRAARIFFFARTIRCAIVAGDARNARATSGVDRPARQRSVSAVCAARGSAGWQQVKNSRSRSSGTSSPSSITTGPARSVSTRSTASRAA